MATPAPRTAAAKRAAAAKQAALAENHTPSEAAAYALVREFTDLEPSVNRIMAAPLDEAGRLHAITLFHASLGVNGDPNRVPANAIAAASALHGEHPVAL
ncbi:MAG: hypothetical protein RLZZ623_1780 [Actinomycetota bacterium]|jgi:hypothetical protein